jgi:hypothetical protein
VYRCRIYYFRLDCPAAWKSGKDRAVRGFITRKIKEFIDPKGMKAKRAKSNAKSNAKNNAKYKASGQRGKWNDKNNAKGAEKLRSARAVAIAANKNNTEETWSRETLAANVAAHVKWINSTDFNVVHHFVGSHANSNTVEAAMNSEAVCGSSCRGNGTPSFLWENGDFVKSVKELEKRIPGQVRLKVAYEGVNELNCDEMEKALHQRHISLPKERRLFRKCGLGTCRSRNVAPGTPYPYYCGTLLILCSLKDAGLRLGNESDRRGKKGPRNSSDGASSKSKKTPDGASSKSKKTPDGASSKSKKTPDGASSKSKSKKKMEKNLTAFYTAEY